MKIFRMRRKLIIRSMIGLVIPLGISTAFADLHVSTGSSSNVGGNGGKIYNPTSCPIDYRVSGIKINHGDVIDKVKFRCTPISSLGKWNGNHFWTSFSKSSAPIPVSKYKTKLCPSNKFIGAIRGWTKNNVLNRVEFKCYKSDGHGQRISSGNNRLSLKASSGGKASGWAYCPGGGFAQKVINYSGWHVDRMKLRCLKGTVVSISKPALTFPNNNIQVSTTSSLQLKWAPVTAASYYLLSLNDQASNTGISPETGNNISQNSVLRVNATQFNVSTAALAKMVGNGRNVRWLVQACPNPENRNGCKSSTSRVFKVKAGNSTVKLSKPNLISPAHATRYYSNNRVTLKWSEVTGARSYLISMKIKSTGKYVDALTGKQVASNKPRRVTAESLMLSISAMNSLASKGDLEWKVRACPNRNDNKSCGNYTNPRRFMITIKR